MTGRISQFLFCGVLLGGCAQEGSLPTEADATGPQKELEEVDRPACMDFNPQRNLYFGDLHVHTMLSFDAYAYDVRIGPTDAYRFAKGEALWLPPLDAAGKGTRKVQLERPLDFAAVTDHAELLAETRLCTDPDSPVYEAERCANFRVGGGSSVDALALVLGSDAPERWADLCQRDDVDCDALGNQIWSETKAATEAAYDRSNACQFTAFHGYEYTSAQEISNQHRNVIFKGEATPTHPITLFDAPRPQDLWTLLDEQCIQASGSCDALAIPHNPNWSNGNLFAPTATLSEDPDEQKALASLRARIEPLVEMFQHKGDAECRNDFERVQGDDDPHCQFEKMRLEPIQDCGEGTGAAAMIGLGCLSRRDFARTTLIEGLREAREHGVNPWKLGFIGGTDTHNGTPGMVEENEDFPGHVGIDDDEPDEKLGFGNLIPGGVLANPGGLVAVWAEQNTRNAIFDSLRRREVYATSGPRITLRFFGGRGIPKDLCSRPDPIAEADSLSTPMGGNLDNQPDTPPSFWVSALADPGTEAHPGNPLYAVQVIKGWLNADGDPVQRIFTIAGGEQDPLTVDTATCEREAGGAMSLCQVWTDPEYVPGVEAIYYARVLEQPSCRYHTYLCNAYSGTELPLGCTSNQIPKIIQERAWSSPIWMTQKTGEEE